MDETADGERPWTLGRRFLLRVAGLPIEAVEALRCDRSRRWADEVVRAEEQLRIRGAQLSDLLHAQVGAAADELGRRQLLRLRRQLFNNRLPDQPTAIGLLDDPLAGQVTAWVRDRRRLEDLHARGTALLTQGIEQTRAALRRRLGEDRLRSALLLASPSLDSQLDAYLRSGSTKLDKRLRKIERSSLTYLYRAACKTSPFSTFTGVKLGRFVDDGAPPLIRLDETWSSHPRLNVVVLNRLAEIILADPSRRGDLPVSLATGWGSEEDRVRFVGSRLTPGDDEAAVSYDVMSDRLVFLRRSGTLDRVLQLFDQRPSLRYGDLVDWLGTQLGAERAECERYLDALLVLGVIQASGLTIDVHSPDPLRAFRDSLLALDRGWARELADRLDGPIAALDHFPRATVAKRRELLQNLRRDLQAVPAALGRAGATLPQVLIYEDTRAGSGIARVDIRAMLDLIGAPLRLLQRVLPAFDLRLPAKLTFKGFFLARYGAGARCDDVLALVHDFHEDLYEPYVRHTAGRGRFDEFGEYRPEENWLGLADIAALDAARQVFVKGMRELWDTSGDAAEVQVDPQMLARVAAELAPLAASFETQSYFMQVVDRAEDPLVVVNKSFGGLCFPFSRFTHCFDPPGTDGLSAQLRRESAALQPDGTVFAEITGGAVTTNLNLHGRLTDHQIVCPGETSSVPQANQIHLADLFAVHDPETDRVLLRSRRLGREVVPVYFGYLIPAALPEIPRTLLLLSSTSAAPLDVWGGVPEGVPDRDVTTRPRVRLGSLVLSRRSWTARAATLPATAPATDAAEWFLDWQRWRHTHHLPDRVFATISDTAASYGMREGKPQYVDFASYLSLTAFAGMVKDPAARVVFREMLPADDELHALSDRGTHVAELAVYAHARSDRRRKEPGAERST